MPRSWNRFVALALILASCAGSDKVTLSQQQAQPLLAAIQRQQEAEATRSAGEAKPSAAAAKDAAPVSAADRRARAKKSFPKDRQPTSLMSVGDGTPYVMAFFAESAKSKRGSRSSLALVDTTADPAALLGWHDFGGDPGDTAAHPASADEPLLLAAQSGQPVALAPLRDGQSKVVALCGWSLAAQRSRFVCAPKLPGPSEYRQHGDELVESWPSGFPPPTADDPPGISGRIYQLSAGGRWTEVDSFRCLARPLAEALDEAGRGELDSWQRNLVGRLTRTAILAGEQLKTDRAVELLREAIEVDSCEAQSWRLLGRLEFEAGRSPDAVPPLAIAAALAPREPAVLVDLADALDALDDSEASLGAYAQARQILSDRLATRELVEGASSAQELARRLYRSYLASTEGDATRQRARRRRVEEQLGHGR